MIGKVVMMLGLIFSMTFDAEASTYLSYICSRYEPATALNNILGKAFLQSWTYGADRCGVLEISHSTEFPLFFVYSSSLSYFDGADTNLTSIEKFPPDIVIENVLKPGESYVFEKANDTYHFQRISSIVAYVPGDGFTLAACPAPGVANFATFVKQLPPKKSVVDELNRQLRAQGITKQFFNVHQGKDCPNY